MALRRRSVRATIAAQSCTFNWGEMSIVQRIRR